jgi:RimJ/RimL family protein N-acetyltransferase
MITIRTFAPPEWTLFREFRLAALYAAPGVFSSAFESEQAAPDSYWRAMLTDPTAGVFGLFDDGSLVGLTAVFTARTDPHRQTAVLAMSFILPEYRGQGLSAMLYDARLDWVRTRPGFRRVIVGHRLSNDVSRRANQRHGFQLIDRTSRVWPDGVEEDELTYELRLA